MTCGLFLSVPFLLLFSLPACSSTVSAQVGSGEESSPPPEATEGNGVDGMPDASVRAGAPAAAPPRPAARSVTWQPVTGRSFLELSADGLTLTKNDGGSEARRSVYASFEVSEGIWYFEARIVRILGGSRLRVGIASLEGRVPEDEPTAENSFGLDLDGAFASTVNGSSTITPGTSGSLKEGDVLGVLFDLGAHAVTFSVNGTNVKTHAAVPDGHVYAPFFFGGINSNGSITANFGATRFAYPPVSPFERPDNTHRRW